VLARMSDGTLRGWGMRWLLATDAGAPDLIVSPRRISGVSGAVDLVVGDDMPTACARDATAKWTCWG